MQLKIAYEYWAKLTESNEEQLDEAHECLLDLNKENVRAHVRARS